MERVVILFFLLLFSCVTPQKDPPAPVLIETAYLPTNTPHILYLAKSGNANKAFQAYRNIQQESGSHDFELLQELCISLLERGFMPQNPKRTLLTMYGIGISGNIRLQSILSYGIASQYPELQLAAVNYLGNIPDALSEKQLNIAMGSNYLPIRLQAAYYLALQHSPVLSSHIEALIVKTPTEFHPLFAELLAIEGSPQSINHLQRMLLLGKTPVVTRAIVSGARYHREEILPEVKTLVTHLNIAVQEASLYALGEFKDSSQTLRMEELTHSPELSVRLAAALALIAIGKENYIQIPIYEAERGSLLAIYSLGQIYAGIEILKNLVTHPNDNVRFNACVALLQHKHPACIATLKEMLLLEIQDTVFQPTQSPGNALQALKIESTSRLDDLTRTYVQEWSRTFQEDLLRQSRELPESAFLQLAEDLLNSSQTHLVASVITLVESINSQSAIAMLKTHQQQIGAPLKRAYCTLALFRLNEEGPYTDQLLHWIQREKLESIIQFRPMVPWIFQQESTVHELTPEEKSRFLIESYQALASKQNLLGIEALVNAIAEGNSDNSYALAGLLLRATE